MQDSREPFPEKRLKRKGASLHFVSLGFHRKRTQRYSQCFCLEEKLPGSERACERSSFCSTAFLEKAVFRTCAGVRASDTHSMCVNLEQRKTHTPCASICFSPTGLATLRLNRSANPACSTIQNLTHNLYKYKLVNINK